MQRAALGCAVIGSGAQAVACAQTLLQRGHTLVGVITDCAQLRGWARHRSIPRIDTSEDALAFLQRQPFDYLLSIVNHAITAPELLATPARGAINYHDSLLPAYGGFNACAWSIIDGQQVHGVTWHEMTAAVDAGRIYVQRRVEIGEDDTAFTLGVKCSEAAMESFSELLSAMEHSQLAGTPQGSGRSFHTRSQRPAAGLLDWTQPAAVLHRWVRGLTFGPDDSWMCMPKVMTTAGPLTVGRSRIDRAQDVPPGTVVAVADGTLSVATADGVLTVEDLATPGAADAGGAPRALDGLVVGSVLPSMVDIDVEAIAELDRRVTGSERFWVRRLVAVQPVQAGSLRPHEGPAVFDTVETSLPAGLDADSDQGQVQLTAALAVMMGRLGEATAFDIGHVVPDVTGGLGRLYAANVPLRVEVDIGQSFTSLCEQVGGELRRQRRRVTYALDAVHRYAELRERAAAGPIAPMPVAIALQSAGAQAQPAAGERLRVCLGDGLLSLRYDTHGLDAEAAAVWLQRLRTLLVAAIDAPDAAVGTLPLLVEGEREQLVHTFQQTARAFESDRCVHHLFEAQAQRTPDAVAARFRDKQWTYRQLDERANAIAAALVAAGVGTETLVGICVRRSLDMLAGMMGILKAGGAYVPLDPVYPKERLGIMLEDSGARVLLTQRALVPGLPAHAATVLCVDELPSGAAGSPASPPADVGPGNLAYVIFTSGSTGRPKGVMVEHRNVTNFFAGMDERVGCDPGVLLAVTSISFDISVLELFWTLARGFEVVIQEEGDSATLARDASAPVGATSRSMDFGLFYFAADSANSGSGEGAYRLLLEGAKYADTHGFAAVWTPERHFHAFGGLYPNPAVTTAALAVVTERVALRAGSVVLPLHNPLRVAEDWSVIDNLSNGRVGLSFASGWHVNDFAFMPDNYERRREIMLEYIDTVRSLWRGESITVNNGSGEAIEVRVLPRPVQKDPALWLASAGNIETFRLAGRLGTDVLTNMLGQDLDDLATKFAAYREARAEAGFQGDGRIAVMLHTYVCEDTEQARRVARAPFCNYLETSFDLVKVAPWMFPAFSRPSRELAEDPGIDLDSFTDEDMEALLDHAFERYFETAGLFGTPERALAMVERLKAIGATECACLIDFGIDTDEVLASLDSLNRLRIMANPTAALPADGGVTRTNEGDFSIAAQIVRHGVTHLQCTPSMARVLVDDPDCAAALGRLSCMMVGGEAFPDELRFELPPRVGGAVINMYGPTETTVWSTTSPVDAGRPVSIGRPIANTVIRIVDAHGGLSPIGTPGELCIGGAGVVRGYLGRPDLTAERFIADPFSADGRLYRTGDLARYLSDGSLEFLGRLDHQVKLNGYRIELGEIESVLGRHAGVHQSVVVARHDGGVPKLVAYVVPRGGGGDEDERVDHWRTLWHEAYRQADRATPAGAEVRFDFSGWTSSYDGQPIPREDMVEWLDGCVERVRALGPRRVLEIGCGTGMVLYRMIDEVEHYTALELSPHALASIEQELTPQQSARFTPIEAGAHELPQLETGPLDTVIINSVCQYFPSAEYLTGVLREATSRVRDGGHIFVGDVRSLAHEAMMMTTLELHQAPGHLGVADLRARIERRTLQQGELLLAPGYFDGLVEDIDRLTGVEYQLKRGEARNEMSRFRYDVVLHVGAGPDAPTAPTVQPTVGPSSMAGILEMLVAEPQELWLVDVPNARLTREAEALAQLERDEQSTAHALLEVLGASAPGIDPEALYQLEHYDVHVAWAGSGALDRVDVLMRHRRGGPRAGWLRPATPRAQRVANEPATARRGEQLVAQLREHLRDYLPEYMIPAAFVCMEALPLTPNGKIDRKALPPPQRVVERPQSDYVSPSNELEKTIAGIWQAMLAVDRVGVHDNIFDLGANSLLTVQANTRLARELGRKVSLVSMFRFPTVHSLAQHLAPSALGDAQALKRTETRDARRQSVAERRRAARARRGN